ncbi:glycosyltransferase family 61 protein [Aporhodopirellula aestuarii]|uniref:Glycosyltransferase family 61 protein n=1 Tax=Aporhodopirellula aestuarii TaxID=2950107 RepID=A0ABT0U5L6_9BACT|nr:glycosyltransferase family 61 protein [Aporhodopirellula aestuarii]MCM2372209.1 glycosyltransferase family 61 protein [Aporhodopirellula aestuarii]
MDIASHNRRLIHYGKYVFAPSTLLPFRRGERKHYNFASMEQLATKFPDRIDVHGLETASSAKNDKFPDSYVASIRDGWCHGRNCDWVGIEDQALQEVRYIAGRLRAKDFSHGYFDPRYLRRLIATPTRFPRPTYISGRVVVLNKVAAHNYFHWLSEVLPRIELVRRADLLDADAYLIDCHKSFQQQSLDMLGIPREKIIEPHEGLLIRAENLIVPSFYSATARQHLGPLMKSALGLIDADQTTTATRRIYVSRRHSKNRNLANEREVSKLLEGFDFETHFLEQYSIEKQIRLFHDAQIVVGLHGAGLTNMIFARPPLHVIEIRPNRCDRTCFAELSEDLGHHLQVVTAEQRKRRGPIDCPLPSLEQAVSETIESLPAVASAKSCS